MTALNASECGLPPVAADGVPDAGGVEGLCTGDTMEAGVEDLKLVAQKTCKGV